jgi:hypothetical protein
VPAMFVNEVPEIPVPALGPDDAMHGLAEGRFAGKVLVRP